MNQTYLLYGTNRDLIEEKKNEIIQKSGTDEFNISVFDMEDSTYEEALHDAYSIPFLSEMRVVVFKDCRFFTTSEKQKNPFMLNPVEENFDSLRSFLENPPKTTIAIFTSPFENVDRKKSIVKAFDKEHIIECKDYNTQDISEYIKNAIISSNHQIERAALEELLNRVKTDNYNFKNEVEKLLLYAKDGEKITLEMVNNLVIKNLDDTLFNLQNAITNKRKKDALESYYNLLNQGYDPLQILASLSKMYQNLLYSKELIRGGGGKEDFMSYYNINKPGRAFYLMRDANNITYSDLRMWMKRLADLDYSIKSGITEKNAGLELLIISS